MAGIRPGDVYGISVADFVYPGTEVGDQPIWSDDSDSSYVDYPPPVSGGGTTEVAQSLADFAEDAFADYAAAALAITIHVKVQVFDPGAIMTARFEDNPPTCGFQVIFEDMTDGWLSSPQLGTADLTYTAGKDLNDLLASPTTIALFNATGLIGDEPVDFRVFEVMIAFGFTLPPPARLSGRGDGVFDGILGGPRRLDTEPVSQRGDISIHPGTPGSYY